MDGYASAFNRLSKDLGGFIEMGLPSSFSFRDIEDDDADRRDWPDVVARFNHDDDTDTE